MPAQHETLPDSLDGERLDRVVAMVSGCSRSEASTMIADGAVTLDGDVVTLRSTKVSGGQEVSIEVPESPAGSSIEPDPSVALDVVHVDDDVIVVDKPAGLVVHPGSGNAMGTLVQGVVAIWPEVAQVGEPERPGIVHRIDKGTSGLLVVARTQRAYESLVDQFGSRSVEREYLALCWGHLDSPSGLIEAPIGRRASDPTKMAVTNQGREARTRFEVRETFSDPSEVSLLACRLETGRTHQIRVHLAAIGHPIVGDRQYGGARSPIPCARPWLHAAQLGFDHPGTGQRLRFRSELPEDLAGVLGGLS
ncbi:MAG: RluA family pseudouridine synthase [Acidimicrobiales bacterium]|nr:RluA family pseudouridine synthase [Acidimicrobiales bacterium]